MQDRQRACSVDESQSITLHIRAFTLPEGTNMPRSHRSWCQETGVVSQTRKMALVLHLHDHVEFWKQPAPFLPCRGSRSFVAHFRGSPRPRNRSPCQLNKSPAQCKSRKMLLEGEGNTNPWTKNIHCQPFKPPRPFRWFNCTVWVAWMHSLCNKE